MTDIGYCISCENLFCPHPNTKKKPKGTCFEWSTPSAAAIKETPLIVVEPLAEYHERMGISYKEEKTITVFRSDLI